MNLGALLDLAPVARNFLDSLRTSWHQDLAKDDHESGFNRRGLFRFDDGSLEIGYQLKFPADHRVVVLSFDDEGMRLSFGLGFFCSIGVEHDLVCLREEREIRFSQHDGRLFWQIWSPSMSWSSTTPRWRDGSVDLVSALLGDAEQTEEVEQAKRVFELPGGEQYEATVSIVRTTTKRPRWYTERTLHARVAVDEGVPVPSKKWGVDRIYESSFPVRSASMDEAVSSFVSGVLRDRMRGGWKGKPAP